MPTVGLSIAVTKMVAFALMFVVASVVASSGVGIGAGTPADAALSPQISITSPQNWQRVRAGAPLRVAGSAQSGSVALRQVKVVVRDTVTKQYVTATGELTGSWTALEATLSNQGSAADWQVVIPDMPAGRYKIRARAFDAERNRTAWTVRRLLVDEAPGATVAVYDDPGQGFRAATGLAESQRFSLSVTGNGTSQPSFVYRSDNDFEPGWSGAYDFLQEANHWTTFSFDGSVEVLAERLDGADIDTCVVRPLHLGITGSIDGSRCSFTLTEPAHLSVEIDEDAVASRRIEHVGLVTKHVVKHPLFVFAEPIEEDVANPGDPNTTYFGPGFHDIGLEHPLPNGHTVYIAGGAVVQGSFINAEGSPSDITIGGRGILTAKGIEETPEQQAGWRHHGISYSGGGTGNRIEGITMTDGLRGAINSYSTVDVSRVKILSWKHRNDGITAGDDSTLRHLFIKAQDDNIKLYASNLVVDQVVVWQQMSGAVLKLAWQLPRPATGNVVTDLTVIHSDVFTDYPATETDEPDLSGKSSIIASMGYRRGGSTTDLLVRDLIVESPNPHRLMALRMVSNHNNRFWGDPDANTTIDGVVVEDLVLAGEPKLASALYGNSNGRISGVEFRNVEVAGRTMTDQGQFDSTLPFVVAGRADGPTYQP